MRPTHRRAPFSILIVLAFSLAGCGGGGGSSSVTSCVGASCGSQQSTSLTRITGTVRLPGAAARQQGASRTAAAFTETTMPNPVIQVARLSSNGLFVPITSYLYTSDANGSYTITGVPVDNNLIIIAASGTTQVRGAVTVHSADSGGTISGVNLNTTTTFTVEGMRGLITTYNAGNPSNLKEGRDLAEADVTALGAAVAANLPNWATSTANLQQAIQDTSTLSALFNKLQTDVAAVNSQVATMTATLAQGLAPVTLSAPGNISNSSMDINWTQSGSSGFKSYRVFYATSTPVTPSGVLADTITDKTTVTKSITGLVEGQTYYVKVYVCDNNNLCVASNEVSASTLAPPAAVTLNPIISAGARSMVLSWSQSTMPTTSFGSYKIYYSTGSQLTDPATLSASISDRTVTASAIANLTPSTRYYIYVAVCASWGECVNSNIVNGTSAGAPPSVILYSPIGPSLTQMTLSWAQSTYTSFGSYTGYYATTAGAPLASSTLAFTVPTVNTLMSNVTGLLPDKTYYFKLYVCSNDFPPICSAASNEVSASTLHDPTPPQVASFSPANGAINVATNSTIFKVTFTKGMLTTVDLNNQTTLNNSGFSVSLQRADTGATVAINSGNALAFGAFAWTKSTVSATATDTLSFTLKPNTTLIAAGLPTLKSNTTYNILSRTVPINLKDSSNNPLDTISNILPTGSFRTGP